MQQAIRPALQRLLARPGSLEVLRVLVGRPGGVRGQGRRGGSALAFGLKEGEELGGWEETRDDLGERREGGFEDVRRFLSMAPERTGFTSLKSEGNGYSRSQPASIATKSRPAMEVSPPTLVLRRLVRGSVDWSKKNWSTKELEFESNLLDLDPSRLLNQEAHKLDRDLWVLLLEYRQRVYGYEGAKMFWDAIIQRGIRLPTRGKAAKAWFWILRATMKQNDVVMLEEVITYSEDFYEADDSWKKLYFCVMEHFLLEGTQEEALLWHARLERNHTIGKTLFGELCYRATTEKGDLVALREIYKQSQHRNLYARIVPHLCSQDDFKGALMWHLLLLENNDLPSTQAAVGPLLKYLSIHHQKDYAHVVEGLHIAEVSFASELPLEFAKITPKNSKDLVSNVHSKTFHVAEKQYNDSLGARWLATSWITLDTAIKAIHALGVSEIGPLSLHSIVLRKPEAESVMLRINQLKDLGISIGNSHFSLAVDYFARTQQQEYLTGLLQSDQHPHELDDTPLQERLLSQYVREKDWPQFRRTLEIISFRCTMPEVEKRNLMMRISIQQANVQNIKHNLKEMQHDGIPIKSTTIHTILEAVLGNRQKGHGPMTPGGTKPPLDDSIDLLRQIIHGGSHVPIKFWREIIKRLGMLGHFHALEDLCLKITEWYGPQSPSHLSRTPLQVPTHSPTHPFRILFQDSLQRAIVEWGFMHTLDGRTKCSDLTVTSGIRLLQKLSKRGVFIERVVVRRAVVHRLRIYYGEGESLKGYNVMARRRLVGMGLGLKEMVEIIDRETGIMDFAGTNIVRAVRGGKSRRGRGVRMGWAGDWARNR